MKLRTQTKKLFQGQQYDSALASFIRGRASLPGDGKWMELEFAGGLFGTGLDWLEIVISLVVLITQVVRK